PTINSVTVISESDLRGIGAGLVEDALWWRKIPARGVNRHAEGIGIGLEQPFLSVRQLVCVFLIILAGNHEQGLFVRRRCLIWLPSWNSARTVAGGNGTERCQFTTQGLRLFWRDRTCGIASAQAEQSRADQATAGEDHGGSCCCLESHRGPYWVQAFEFRVQVSNGTLMFSRIGVRE